MPGKRAACRSRVWLTGSGDKVARMLGPRQQEDLSYRSKCTGKETKSHRSPQEGFVWKCDVI